MSITRKILVACLAGIVPLTAVGWFAVQRAQDAMSDEALAGLARVADLEKGSVDSALDAMDDRLAVVTDQPGPLAVATVAYLAQPDTVQSGAVADVLGGMTRSIPELRAASVYDLSGSLIADTRTSADQPTRTVPAPLLAAGRVAPVVGRAFRTLANDDRRYQHARPIHVDGVVVAVLVAESNLAPVVRPLAGDRSLGDTVEAALVQRKDDGSAEFISDLRFERNAAFRKTIPADQVDTPAVRAVNGADTEMDRLRDYRDQPVVAAFRTIDGADWGLVVKMDRSEAYASARELASLLRVAALVGSVGLAVVSFGLARSIIRRVRRVTAMAEAISRGDLSLRVDDRSRDELGRLARAFDLMAEHLAADIAERERVEAMLEHQARHDALTGLPNRTPAYERLSTALAGGSERGVVGLLFCDLDSFKAVNDELGHSAGDELLQQVAQRLRTVVGDDHTVARFGGDEFVLVCEDLDHVDDIEALAARLRGALVEPFTVHGREVVTTMSVGSVIAAPDDDVTPESLVRDADAAMYRAKELGRDRHVPLDDGIRLRASTRFSATMDLRRAIDEERLELWYQPIVELATGRTSGVESLLRWPPGSLSVSSPSSLVELADQSGLAVALDRWVLETACRQLRQWADEGQDELTLAVNVSGAMVGDPGLVEAVTDVIGMTGIAPGRLCIEVTEVAFRGDDDGAARALDRLRRVGVRVAIDDFGTGYSSLDRLRRLPVNALKVDRTFVRDVDVDPAARAIVGSVLGLGATLGMDVVAEGVERESQHRTLQNLGCVAGQGWFYAKARPAAEISELVAVPLVNRDRRHDLVPASAFSRD